MKNKIKVSHNFILTKVWYLMIIEINKTNKKRIKVKDFKQDYMCKKILNKGKKVLVNY